MLVPAHEKLSLLVATTRLEQQARSNNKKLCIFSNKPRKKMSATQTTMASLSMDPNTIIQSAPFDATYLEFYFDTNKMDAYLQKQQHGMDVVIDLVTAFSNQALGIYQEAASIVLLPNNSNAIDAKAKEQLLVRYARWMHVASRAALQYHFALSHVEQVPLAMQRHLLVALIKKQQDNL